MDQSNFDDCSLCKFELQLVRTNKEQPGAIQDMPKKTLKVESGKFE